MVSSFGGVVTWSSVTGLDSDGAGAGSVDVASVVSTVSVSLGTSASYTVDKGVRNGSGIERTKAVSVGAYNSLVDGFLQVLLGDQDAIVVADRRLGGAGLWDRLNCAI